MKTTRKAGKFAPSQELKSAKSIELITQEYPEIYRKILTNIIIIQSILETVKKYVILDHYLTPETQIKYNGLVQTMLFK